MNSNIDNLRTERILPDLIRPDDSRNEFDRDYGRIVHSPAFRRLQGKSQVFGAGSGDYYRTRLTHSLEVAQIARHVATRLNEKYQFLNETANPAWVINPKVVEVASLAHDLGHPPFGHKGEALLNGFLLENGDRTGFEGNAQNFRILMKLEKGSRENSGLNLTSAVLLGINKYPFRLGGAQRKGLYPSEWKQLNQIRIKWGLPDGARTLEAQLMDLCDDIAYSTHDVEDGIRAGKINMLTFANSQASFQVATLLIQALEKEREKDKALWEGMATPIDKLIPQVLKALFVKWSKYVEKYNGDTSRARRDLRAEWVNRLVTHVGIVDEHIGPTQWKRVTFVKRDGKENLPLRRFMIVLKKLAWVTMVSDVRVQRLQYRSGEVLKGLWEAFHAEKDKIENNEASIFPSDWAGRFRKESVEIETWGWNRFVSDYISGMTDFYAEKVYHEMKGGRLGSIYELE